MDRKSTDTPEEVKECQSLFGEVPRDRDAVPKSLLETGNSTRKEKDNGNSAPQASGILSQNGPRPDQIKSMVEGGRNSKQKKLGKEDKGRGGYSGNQGTTRKNTIDVNIGKKGSGGGDGNWRQNTGPTQTTNRGRGMNHPNGRGTGHDKTSSFGTGNGSGMIHGMGSSSNKINFQPSPVASEFRSKTPSRLDEISSMIKAKMQPKPIPEDTNGLVITKAAVQVATSNQNVTAGSASDSVSVSALSLCTTTHEGLEKPITQQKRIDIKPDSRIMYPVPKPRTKNLSASSSISKGTADDLETETSSAPQVPVSSTLPTPKVPRTPSTPQVPVPSILSAQKVPMASTPPTPQIPVPSTLPTTEVPRTPPTPQVPVPSILSAQQDPVPSTPPTPQVPVPSTLSTQIPSTSSTPQVLRTSSVPQVSNTSSATRVPSTSSVADQPLTPRFPASSRKQVPAKVTSSVPSSNDVVTGNHSALMELVNREKLKRDTMMVDFLSRPRQPPRESVKVKLPIHDIEAELIAAVKKNQFLIVVGEAGCGKSTQIPQFLLNAKLNRQKTSKVIGITEPRRLAATTLATRVAAERNVRVGTEVGYSVRFENKVTSKTVIKYMTDGTLVRECTADPTFSEYSIIIVDEAHERHQETDICFGLLKRVAKDRPELKIIICSATLNEQTFQDHFEAPVFRIPKANTFQVDTSYLTKSYEYEEDCFNAVAAKVFEINKSGGKGVILVFLSGQEEIETVQGLLEEKLGKLNGKEHARQLLITPCFANLPYDEQQKIFQPTPTDFQKVVLATNIAETSLTIDSVEFVIDTGFFKQNEYDAESGIYNLVKQPITKFQAIQREGRAGRTVAGKCFRMYTKADFEEMAETVPPEIIRSNLDNLVLLLLSMNVMPIPGPGGFDYINAPDIEFIGASVLHLQQLSALDKSCQLSDMGRRMARLPLDPQLSRSVLMSETLGCSKEVVIIASLLSTQCKNIFNRDQQGRHQAAKARARFMDTKHGDLITLLKICNEWAATPNPEKETWCKRNFLQSKILKEADEIAKQISAILKLSRNREDSPLPFDCSRASLIENIHRSFTVGFFRHLARKRGSRGVYQTFVYPPKHEDVHLSLDSALIETNPEWLIFQEVKRTRKTYIREAFPVDPLWIQDYAKDHADSLQACGIVFP